MMAFIKRFIVWSDSEEAVLGSVILTLLGACIQLVMGIIALHDLQVYLQYFSDEAIPLGVEMGNMLLVCIDLVLTVSSLVLLIALCKGKESALYYVPFISVLAVRLMYEFFFAVYIFRWYIKNDLLSVQAILRASVYMLRTTIWVYSLLCVMSRYQESREKTITGTTLVLIKVNDGKGDVKNEADDVKLIEA